MRGQIKKKFLSKKPASVPIAPKLVMPATPSVLKKELSVDANNVKIGAKVRHKKFGDGEIVKYNDVTMTVRFASGGEKTLSIQITLENHIIEFI